MFQSTRPRGARPDNPMAALSAISCFNPRARVGRDRLGVVLRKKVVSFNPRARVGRDCYGK